MKGPDFLIVGAPKCGTTALDSYLAKHPQIYMAVKETHFFAPDMNPRGSYYERQDRYLALFDLMGEEKIAGESSVIYLYSRVAAQRIREFNKDANIIIMLRNPVDVIESYHSELVFDCQEDITDLGAALEAENARFMSPPERGNRSPPEFLYYRRVVSFYEQVKRYMDLFGEKHVHIILFDDFKRDTPQVYRRTLEFLGVNPGFRPSFDVVNPNKLSRSKLLARWMRRPGWLHRAGRTFLPHPVRSKLGRTLLRLNTRFTLRGPMDPELRHSLLTELRPGIESLGELIGHDLTAWYGEGA